LKPKLTTVIFDYGGVLGLPLDPDREAAMMALTRLPRAEFYAAYRRDRVELDRGTLATDEYWRRLFAAGGVRATPALLAQIEREDALGWSRVNQKVVDWSYELRDAGYLTGILSNMPSEKLKFMQADGQFRWIKDFDVAVFSCEHLLVKPEASIYRLCLEKLGARPEECIFLDDVPENAEGARSVGIHALVFRSPDAAATELQRDWGLPVGKLRNGARS
jgi:putative hydrolase of the HAD superfamily